MGREEVLDPPRLLREPVAAHHVGLAVGVDVERQVHEVVGVALAVLLHVALDLAHLAGLEVGGEVEVGAGDDVELAVVVEVRHAARLRAAVADAARLELHAAHAAGDARHGAARLLALLLVRRLAGRGEHGGHLRGHALQRERLVRLHAHAGVGMREERRDRAAESERVAHGQHVEELREERGVLPVVLELVRQHAVRTRVGEEDEPAARGGGDLGILGMHPDDEPLRVVRAARAPETLKCGETHRRECGLLEDFLDVALCRRAFHVRERRDELHLRVAGEFLQPGGAHGVERGRGQERDRLRGGAAPLGVGRLERVASERRAARVVRAQETAERGEALVLRQLVVRVHARVARRGLGLLPRALAGVRRAQVGVGVRKCAHAPCRDKCCQNPFHFNPPVSTARGRSARAVSWRRRGRGTHTTSNRNPSRG